MLSGTFDLFPLSEVLGLIQRADASGALIVRGREVDGTLYFASGQMCGGEVSDLAGPVEGQDALETRLLEVCVSMLRSRGAEFDFRPDVTPAWPAPLIVPIDAVFPRAYEIARDWSAIMTAIESFESILERTGSITTESLTLSRLGFRVLELVDGSATIRELARRADASLIIVGPEVRALVVAGAVRVIVDADRALATARAEAESDRVGPERAVDVTIEPVPPAPARPSPPAPEPVPVAAAPAPRPDPVVAPSPAAPALEGDQLARERADLASHAGLTDPGPAPEPAATEPEPATTPRADRGGSFRTAADVLRTPGRMTYAGRTGHRRIHHVHRA